MSIPVDVAELETVLEDFGAGYLLSTAPHGRIKAVTVEPRIVDGALVIEGPGGGSSRNIAENAQVTVLFPPRERHGYTLLIDGAAKLADEVARISPASAVLHRPAAHGDGTDGDDGCSQDCRHV